MKHAKRAALACAAITTVLALVLAGCGGGGSSSQNPSANWGGSIYGVQTLPEDGETEVSTDTAFKVSWPDPTRRPPADFQFDLDIEDTPGHFTDVNTAEMTDYSDPNQYYWWFEPASALQTSKWYRLTLTDDRSYTEVVFFRTSDTPASNDGSAAMRALQVYRPEGEKNRSTRSAGQGMPTVTVRTK